MMRAAHYINAPLSKYYLDYRVLYEANLAILHTFNLDIVQTISDPYRKAADAGLVVELPVDNLPLNKKPLMIEPDDLYSINFPAQNFGLRMTDRLEAVRTLHDQVGAETPVVGWVEGALAEAAGCEIPDQTRAENIHAQNQALQGMRTG